MAPNFQLRDDQSVAFQIIGKDADGNVAALPDGATVSVTSSDTQSASVSSDTPPADGTIASGTFVASSKLGTVQLSVSVTGADGSTIATGSQSIDIVSGALATIAVNLGTPAATGAAASA